MNERMLSVKQEQFLKNDLSRINLLYGSVRSGKTWISLLKWALWVGNQPEKQEFLMVSKTITTLKRNCLGLLQTLIGRHLTYSLPQKKAYIFGRCVWLEGANDERSESKIRGMTLKGVYIDELTQIPRDFYLMALSRLSEQGASLIATTNPDSPNHYVKTEIIDNPDLNKQVVKFLLDDNIFLDEQYKRNLRKEYAGVFYSRFIEGNFVRAEGVVFRDFAENASSYLIAPAQCPSRLRTVGIGYDLGGSKSNFALVATGITFDNRVIVLEARELAAENVSLGQVEQEAKAFIEKIERDYGVRADYCYIDDNYYTTVNSLNGWRYMFDSAARIKTAMPLADRPLMLSKLMAQGRFKLVGERCEPLIYQLRNAVFDGKKEKAVICDDGSMNIDSIDAFFYSIADDYLYLSEE